MPISNDDELMREFLLESWEGLNQLDQDFVALESNPSDQARLGAIFRCIHTIKGAAGFLSLKTLESVAHAGESLLSRLRNGDFLLDELMTSMLLSMVDAIRAILGSIESSGSEGADTYTDLIAKLAELSTGLRTDLNSLSLSAGTAVAAVAPKSEQKKPAASTQPTAPHPESPAARDVAPAAHTTSSTMENTIVHDPEPAKAAPGASCPEPRTAANAAPKEAPHEPAEAGAQKANSISDTAIRVDVGLLDRVMNLVGELVLARNQIIQYGVTVKDASFSKASQRLNMLTTELQEGVMKTRMQPIGNVWNKFPRVVRTCRRCAARRSPSISTAPTPSWIARSSRPSRTR